MEVIVPPNTAATVYVPVLPHGAFDKAKGWPEHGKDAVLVTESGKSVDQVKGVRFLRIENGAAVYEAGSGCYKFDARQGVPK